MKRKSTSLILLTMIGAFFFHSPVKAQEADEIAKITIDAKVTLNGRKASDLKDIVYQDNRQISSQNIRKNSFDLELDLNNAYTLQVSKDGFKTYRLFIDGRVSTNLDQDQKLKMEIDLLSQGPVLDPYYTDFPDGIMSWDARTEMFAERGHYSEHIFEKKSPLQADASE